LRQCNRDVNELAPDIKVSGATKQPFHAAKPRVILALSGGGCKAVAEIGVLRTLEKHKIAIDGIIGTSMGATIGALYCAGVPLDEIEAMFLSGDLQKNMFRGIAPRVLTAPLAPVAHVFKGKTYGGLSTGKNFEKFLSKRLPATFAELKIPLGCVVTNLEDGKTEVLTKGDLPISVVASNCVPIICKPIEINNHLYVDGALRANLPSEIAKTMKPDLVIAALVDAPINVVDKETFRSNWQILGRVVDIVLANTDKPKAAESDVLIFPDTEGVSYMTSKEELLRKAIKSGEDAAEAVAPRIDQVFASNEKPPSAMTAVEPTN